MHFVGDGDLMISVRVFTTVGRSTDTLLAFAMDTFKVSSLLPFLNFEGRSEVATHRTLELACTKLDVSLNEGKVAGHVIDDSDDADEMVDIVVIEDIVDIVVLFLTSGITSAKDLCES